MAVTAAQTTTSFLSTTATATAIPFLSTSKSARDNVTSRTTLMTVTITTNETSFNATTFPEAVIEGSGMGMVLVPFGIITVIGLAVAIMLYIRKRKRLEKLRHQLMPMYNFDPAEEQDDLLEQELLDHGREGSLTGPNAKPITQQLILSKNVSIPMMHPEERGRFPVGCTGVPYMKVSSAPLTSKRGGTKTRVEEVKKGIEAGKTVK